MLEELNLDHFNVVILDGQGKPRVAVRMTGCSSAREALRNLEPDELGLLIYPRLEHISVYNSTGWTGLSIPGDTLTTLTRIVKGLKL